MKYLLLFLLLAPAALFAQRPDSAKYVMHAPGDTARPKSPLETLWESQTLSGQNAITENATAGFFSTGKNAGIYAFHNTAPRGTVLKVRNLNNDRVIFVKVLGPLPNTKQFAGCSLGLSGDAKSSLGARNTRVLCEISYMGH